MTRNWKKYNEELVKRGEFYLRPNFHDVINAYNSSIYRCSDSKKTSQHLYILPVPKESWTGPKDEPPDFLVHHTWKVYAKPQ